MAAPTFTSAISLQTTDSATIAWTLPTGNASGKILVLLLYLDGVGTGVPTTPTGFTLGTLSCQTTPGGSGSELYSYYKITDGSEASGNITLSSGTEKAVVISLLITNADTTDLPFAKASTSTLTTLNPDPPSVTANRGALDNLFFTGCITSAAGEDATTWTRPTGYSLVERGNSGTADSTHVQAHLGYKTVTATATDNPSTWTIGSASDNSAVFTFVFSPASTPVNAYPPPADNSGYFNDFIANFGIASNAFSHTEILSLFSSLHPSGDRLRTIDTDYVEIKVPPASGTLYERVRFRPNNLGDQFVNLGSGLYMTTNYDFSTNSPSGCRMEIWLESGNAHNGDYYWYSGPITLTSGTNFTTVVGSGTRYTSAANYLNSTISIGVKYDYQSGHYNELKVNYLNFTGEGWFYPTANNSGVPLFTQGVTYCTSSIPLFTQGLSSNTSGLPLYLKGLSPESGYIPLFIFSASAINSGIPLYIKGGLSDDMPLFLKGVTPNSENSGIPLVMFAIHAGTSGLINTLPLFMSGDNTALGSMNLYIDGWIPPTRYTSNMPLYLKNGNNDGTTDSYQSLPLFLYNQVSGYNDNIPLFLYNEMGGSGGVPTSGSMNLYIARNSEATAYAIPMFTQGPSGVTESLPLYLLCGYSGTNNNIPMYTVGKDSGSGIIPLFVRGL